VAKGDLKRFWVELKGMDKSDPRRAGLQKDINRIEKWMIESGKFPDMKITNWSEGFSGNMTSLLYPYGTGCVWFNDIFMLKEYNSKGFNVDRKGIEYNG